MVKPGHLRNAPIVEALIDFRVKLPSSFNIIRFLPLKDKLHDSYPRMEEKRQIQVGLQVTEKRLQQTLQDTGLHGYFFYSADGTNIAQFRPDGFTFNRLRPYTSWGTVLAEAKRLWMLYVTESSPELITRIAVRYINQIDIPLPIVSLKSYLTAPPTPPKMPRQDINHFMTRDFMTRMGICDEGQNIFANITQALQKSAKPEHVSIILDIDVFKTEEGGFEDSNIWPTFERLRELKNLIFFSSITEKTVRLCK